MGHSPEDVHVMPGDLSEPERAVWLAFPRGGWVDLRSGSATEDDVSNGARWDAGRAVRAEVIRALLLGACPAEPGYTAALRLRGARIAGHLDLSGAALNYALACQDCFFDSLVCLAGASARAVRFSGSRLLCFNAARFQAAGMLNLQDAIVVEGIGLDYGMFSGGVSLRGQGGAWPRRAGCFR